MAITLTGPAGVVYRGSRAAGTFGRYELTSVPGEDGKVRLEASGFVPDPFHWEFGSGERVVEIRLGKRAWQGQVLTVESEQPLVAILEEIGRV